MADTYKIVRFYQDGLNGRYRMILKRGLTLKEAQTHCNDPETSSRTATSARAKERTRLNGAWFDGYEKE